MSLTSELNKKGLKVSYKIAEVVNGEDEYYNQSSLKVYRADIRRPLATFYFQARQLPYCCGIYELGSFRAEQSRTVTDSILQQATKALVARTIKKLNANRSFMANLVENAACNIVKEGLQELNFTMLKEFTNPGSGNIIQVFMNS